MKNLFVLAIGFLVGAAAFAQTEKYNIDPAHTSVVFKIDHLGFSDVYGMFPGVSGKFEIDEAKPENSKIDIKIKADSVSTHEAKRDKHLKSPDFFNVKQNKEITFKSKSVKKAGDKTYQVTGDLTLNGVTKPLSFEFKRYRTGQDPWGKTRTGGATSFKVKRSDFNMNFMQGENQLGDEVEMIVSLEGVRE